MFLDGILNKPIFSIYSKAPQERHRKTISTVQTTTSEGQQDTNTFLTDRSKVTGVQDVIYRMKNEGKNYKIIHFTLTILFYTKISVATAQYEDTEEDTEARNLLNKFIGSQVLLSGMEPHVKKQSSHQHDAGEGKVQRTIKITTTTKTSVSRRN